MQVSEGQAKAYLMQWHWLTTIIYKPVQLLPPFQKGFPHTRPELELANKQTNKQTNKKVRLSKKRALRTYAQKMGTDIVYFGEASKVRLS